MKEKIKRFSLFSSVSLLLLLCFIGCAESTNPVVRYKITYESSFGSQLNEITLDENTKLEQKHLPSLSDADNKFLGWFNGDDEIKVGDLLKSDLALKAKWENLSVNEVSFSSESVDKGDSITLSSMVGATIYYTTDGTDPKLKVNKYTGPIVINDKTTIKAYAVKEGRKDSKVVTKTITIKTYSVIFQDPLNFIKPFTTSGYPKGTPFRDVTKPSDKYSVISHEFLGWKEDGKTALVKDDDQITDNVVYKASWRSCIGDIILNDGSTVPNTEITEEQKNNAIAVTCGFNDKGQRIGLGLNISELLDHDFCLDNTIAYKKDITAIKVTGDKNIYSGDAVYNAKLNGDKDGSDNWNEIVKVYVANSKTPEDALNDCPAFMWANNYGTTYYLPDRYKDGWYIPSIIEAFDYILKNSSVLNESLATLNKSDLSTQGLFISSSQGYKKADYVWRFQLDPKNLFIGSGWKANQGTALCLKIFD